jgi:hypothetical protein
MSVTLRKKESPLAFLELVYAETTEPEWLFPQEKATSNNCSSAA